MWLASTKDLTAGDRGNPLEDGACEKGGVVGDVRYIRTWTVQCSTDTRDNILNALLK